MVPELSLNLDSEMESSEDMPEGFEKAIESAKTPVKDPEVEPQPKTLLHRISKKDKIRKSTSNGKTIKDVILDAIDACKHPEKGSTSYVRIKKYAESVGVTDKIKFKDKFKKMLEEGLVRNATSNSKLYFMNSIA